MQNAIQSPIDIAVYRRTQQSERMLRSAWFVSERVLLFALISLLWAVVALMALQSL